MAGALETGERGAALAQRLDAGVGGVDPPRLLLGLLLQLGGGTAQLVGVVLRDQLAVGALDLGISGIGGQPQLPVRVLLVQADPVAVKGMSQQQADHRAEQRIGPEQQGPGDETEQFSVPAHGAPGSADEMDAHFTSQRARTALH